MRGKNENYKNKWLTCKFKLFIFADVIIVFFDIPYLLKILTKILMDKMIEYLGFFFKIMEEEETLMGGIDAKRGATSW